MGIVDTYSPIPGGAVGLIAHHLIRFIQFIIALSVIGLYAQDLTAAHKVGAYTDSNWAYAVVVGTFSAVAALAYFIPIVTRAFFRILWPIDVVLWILYLALFADFGSKYIKADPQNTGHGDGPGIQRMKNAVWVDLVGMLLWFVTAVWGGISFCLGRRSGRTVHTGRAAL
jgi:hypothetical protein